MNNIAYHGDYQEIKEVLSSQMIEFLRKTKDPRVLGQKIIWDSTKHYNLSNNTPRPSKEMIEMFGLKEQYNYFPDSVI